MIHWLRAAVLPALIGLSVGGLLLGARVLQPRDGEAANNRTIMLVRSLDLRLSFPELVHLSDAIIVGRVEGPPITAFGPSGLPEQRWTVQVQRTLRGAIGPSVELPVVGGTIGDLTAVVEAEPTLADGNSAVVFLTLVEGRYVVQGRWQGYQPMVGPDATAFGVSVDRLAELIADVAAGRSTSLDGWIAPLPPEPVQASYELKGTHWAASAMPVGFWVNSSGGPSNIAAADFERVVSLAFERWKAAPAGISYTDRGQTSLRVPEPYKPDFVNVVQWGGPLIDGQPKTTFGTMGCVYQPSTSEHVDCDINLQINAASPWSLALPIEDPHPQVPTGTADVFYVTLHEVGHFWGLAHSDVTASVMGMGVNARVPYPDDIAGIQAIYGAGGGVPTATATPTASPTTVCSTTQRSVGTQSPIGIRDALTRTVYVPFVADAVCS